MARKDSKPYRRKRTPAFPGCDTPIAEVEYEEMPQKPGWHSLTLVGECPRCHGLTQVEDGVILFHLIPTDETYREYLGRERPSCAGSGLLPVGNKVKHLRNIKMQFAPAKRLWALLGDDCVITEIHEITRMPVHPCPYDDTAVRITKLLAEKNSPTVGVLQLVV